MLSSLFAPSCQLQHATQVLPKLKPCPFFVRFGSTLTIGSVCHKYPAPGQPSLSSRLFEPQASGTPFNEGGLFARKHKLRQGNRQLLQLGTCLRQRLKERGASLLCWWIIDKRKVTVGCESKRIWGIFSHLQLASLLQAGLTSAVARLKQAYELNLGLEDPRPCIKSWQTR